MYYCVYYKDSCYFMGKQQYSLIIKNPCNESWSTMTQAGLGKYCENCKKVVFDLTYKTDSEIIQIINQESIKICGRLNQSQVSRPLISKKTNSNTLKKLILALLIFLFPSREKAQKVYTPKEKLSTQLNPNKLHKKSSVQSKVKPSKNKSYFITGTVFDSVSGAPMDEVMVWVNNSFFGCLTGNKGEIYIRVEDTIFKNRDKIELILQDALADEPKKYYILLDKKDIEKPLKLNFNRQKNHPLMGLIDVFTPVQN